ncbi:MAG: tyrosine-type recombinase/integrase [bacterium]
MTDFRVKSRTTAIDYIRSAGGAKDVSGQWRVPVILFHVWYNDPRRKMGVKGGETTDMDINIVVRAIREFTAGSQYATSITTKGDRPHLLLRVIKASDRTERTFSLRTSNKKEAKRMEAEILQRLSQAARSGVVQIETVRFFDEWLAGIAPTIKHSSYARYKPIVMNAISFLPQEMCQISIEHLERLKSSLYREGKKERTILMALNTLSQVFKQAVKLGYMASNPMDHIDRPKKPQTTVERYKEDELIAIFGELQRRTSEGRAAHCAEAWSCYGEVFHIMNYTGMRVGDAIALKWDNVNFPFSVLSFVQEKTVKPSNVRMPSALKQRLRCILEKQVRDGSYDPNGYVFLNTNGKPPTYTRLDLAIRSVLKAVNLKKQSPIHSFRHTVAMRLLDGGVKIHEVAAQLGDTVETIVRTYVKPAMPSLSSIDAAFDGMERKWNADMDKTDGLAIAASVSVSTTNPQISPIQKSFLAEAREPVSL